MPNFRMTALCPDDGPHGPIVKAAGFNFLPAPVGTDMYQAGNLLAALKDVHAVLAGSEPYTREILQQLPNLRVIARAGVGFDAVDLKTCDERGIVVTTTPGVNHHAVAEHAIGMLMALARGFPELHRWVHAGTWIRKSRPRVMGRTLGLVGLGRIGRAVATRAVGLGMKVIAVEPYPDPSFIKQWNIEVVSFDQLLQNADFVSLHQPLSPETYHMMNAQRFAQMKRGAILINTARGGLVDESALIAALQSGHLGGACLDVFEVEPLPLTSPLLKLDRVLLSGHVAGMDNEAQHDTLVMASETIVQLYRGGWPADCIQNLKGVKNWKW